MIRRFFATLREYIFPSILITLAVILSVQNYTPGTFLSGWDTLHPEFNFPLAFTRMLHGVWRADQGLGAVAIQSHMADLPRVVYLYLASFALPLSFLRYSYFFLMLIAGPLGMYALVSQLMCFTPRKRLLGFIGGITYLMNLGTVQHFIVPLEMFATQYGLLPWLMLGALKVFEHPTRKHLIIYSFLTLLAAPQAHTATLFYAYVVGLTAFLVTMCFAHVAHFWTLAKRACMILGITLAMNAFFVLPNLYAAVTHGLDVRDSKVNRLFSPEAFAKNQEFGTIQNAVILKNFSFDWELYRFDKQPQKFEQILAPWIKHLGNPYVQAIGYGVFILALAGLEASILYKKKTLIAFVPIFGISLVMLLNGTYPFTILFQNLGDISPLLQEALRFPFTKFSILFMMTLSVFAAYGFFALIELSHSLYKHHRMMALIYALFLGVYFYPAFNGNLIHTAMRISIPNEYFSMFDWFTSQGTNGRVAILPIHSFWNWTYYTWGYQGAGFLQFGIPQPILDRDYDRWSPFNEQYQREMSYAIYSEKPELLRSVLQKYSIHSVLVDDSVMNMGGRDEATFKWAIPGLLNQTGLVSNITPFGEHISVYTIKSDAQEVFTYSELPSVGPSMIGASEDSAYSTIGAYATVPNGNTLYDKYRESFTKHERFDIDTKFADAVATVSASIENLLPIISCSTSTTYQKRDVLPESIRYTSNNGPMCDHFTFDTLPHTNAYILQIKSKYIQGFPLQICVSNPFNKRCSLFTHLDKKPEATIERFLLPPLSDWHTGYTIDINNFAIRGQTSINELIDVSIYPFDYSNFSSIYQNYSVNPASATPMTIEKTFLWYKIVQYNGSDRFIALDEAYDSGWKLFTITPSFPFVAQAGEHILINNWMNGWKLDNQEDTAGTYMLIFLPQIFEYIGIIGVVLISIWVIRTK